VNYLIYDTSKIVKYNVGWPIQSAKIEPSAFFAFLNNVPIKYLIIKQLTLECSMSYSQYDKIRNVIREW